MIYSSDSKGQCYLNTKNLDGENNLKKKSVPLLLRKILNDENVIL